MDLDSWALLTLTNRHTGTPTLIEARVTAGKLVLDKCSSVSLVGQCHLNSRLTSHNIRFFIPYHHHIFSNIKYQPLSVSTPLIKISQHVSSHFAASNAYARARRNFCDLAATVLRTHQRLNSKTRILKNRVSHLFLLFRI